MQKRLLAIKENIYHNNEIIKDISLTDDIDSDKSDMYYLDSKGGFLEFCSSITEKVGYRHYIDIIGQSEAVNNHIALIPDSVDNAGMGRHLNILLDKNICIQKADAIHIKFKKLEVDSFAVCIINKSFKDVLQKMHDKLLPIDARFFSNGNTKRLKVNINSGKNIQICSYYNNKAVSTYSTILDVKDKVKELLIYIRNPALLVNGSKYNIPVPNDFYEEKIYIDLTAYTNRINDDYGDILVESVALCNNKGYVYFKPIQINVKRTRVYALYSGCARFEYFCSRRDKWVELNENSVIEEKLLSIRILMCTYDRLYSLILVHQD